MKKETLKSIFNFIEEKEAHKTPFLWKLQNNEPISKKDLHIKGDLDLTNRKITSLPKGLKVRGNLFLEYCSKLTSLPEGLEVGYDLYLTESPNITSLPKGLKVYFDLYIADTKLEVYTDEELREMVKPDGFIKGMIFR